MIEDRIKNRLERHKELEQLLSSQEISGDLKKIEEYSREYNHLNKMMPIFHHYLEVKKQIVQTKQILKSESDQELLALAHQDIEELEKKIPELEQQIKFFLVPKDPADIKNAIVEIRAGTGGTEAGIFAADLYRMYSVFIEKRGWGKEVMSTSPGEKGALKEIIFMVTGDHVYGTLKYESGVHRVQRVPETEAQGRIHTSAASVVVFPEADDIEFSIDPKDLRIDVFRSSGPGGQSVNTTDSAVRVVHVPTGIIVTCQDEKSQHKNKAKALQVLKSRLFDMKRSEIQAKEAASRKSIIGSGDRSAKIRTYNFPQNRVTDHRINLSLYHLDKIINGSIDELIDSLSIADLDLQVKSSE